MFVKPRCPMWGEVTGARGLSKTCCPFVCSRRCPRMGIVVVALVVGLIASDVFSLLVKSSR